VRLQQKTIQSLLSETGFLYSVIFAVISLRYDKNQEGISETLSEIEAIIVLFVQTKQRSEASQAEQMIQNIREDIFGSISDSTAHMKE